MQLIATNINRKDTLCSTLKHTVGEATCRDASIHHRTTHNIDAKSIQCVRQLFPTPTHKLLLNDNGYWFISCHHAGGLVGESA